jgi:hypothetical protein
MTKPLTRSTIIAEARRNKKLAGADLAWDEPGRCIITLRDGITWCPQDGNRHVEGFVYDDAFGDERDTEGYFRERLSCIEKEI